MSVRTLAMIPARMGSKRLEKKNLRTLDGEPLITRAIRRCVRAYAFDEIWVNSESEMIETIAREEGVSFHRRPTDLASDSATSEDFVQEFLQAHTCDVVVQVHSVAPLLGARRIAEFVDVMIEKDYDTMLSCVPNSLEHVHRGEAVNFSTTSKTNSQDLDPVSQISWSISGWKRDAFLKARASGGIGTYSGRIGYFDLDRLEGLAIKTEQDLRIAEALLPLAAKDV